MAAKTPQAAQAAKPFFAESATERLYRDLLGVSTSLQFEVALNQPVYLTVRSGGAKFTVVSATYEGALQKAHDKLSELHNG